MHKFKGIAMPFILIFVVVSTLFGGHYLNTSTQAFFFALSLSLKEMLLCILPLMIFAFVLRSLLKLRKNAVSFVLLLIPMIILSNFISTCLAYKLGGAWLEYNCFTCTISKAVSPLEPLWLLHLPRFIPNDYALLAGLVIGIGANFYPMPWLDNFSEKLVHYVEIFLNKLFMPLIPLFIFGFVLDLQATGVLQVLVTNYTSVLASVGILCFSYITLVYGLLQRFNPIRWITSLQNMLPAALTGLSTMSSAAAMPLTLKGVEKNVADTMVVQTVVPATVNIHLIGDCFAIPIFALALMVSFNQGLPDLSTFIKFASYFVLAKFAVAAVPGGGILVMLPILERYLNFSPEMLSLITALYILFDPIITTANVLGNGAFAQLFAKIYKKTLSRQSA